jgi:3-oxoacyl-[acyl-carrier-protein] synthase III
MDEAEIITNLDRFGSTSAVEFRFLSEWPERGLLRCGDRIVLTAFGAGFTAAEIHFSWAVSRPATLELGRDTQSAGPPCAM